MILIKWWMPLKCAIRTEAALPLLRWRRRPYPKEGYKLCIKKEYKEKLRTRKYPSVSYEVAAQIQEKIRQGGSRDRARTCTEKAGSPCPYDRVFASRLGSEAGKLIMEEKIRLYGRVCKS